MADGQFVILIIRITLGLMISLTKLEDLSQCQAPMHIFIIGEWIGIGLILIMVILSINSIRIGDVVGPLVALIFVIWNFAGIVMYIISLSETPQCIPGILKTELFIFFACLTISFLVLGFYLCKEGLSWLRGAFHDEGEAGNNIRNLADGNVQAAELIRINQARGMNVDNHLLYQNELGQLEMYCGSRYRMERVDDDTECIICMAEFDFDAPIIKFPVCKHKYHKVCLWEWFRAHTTCPICRRGARAGLYTEIENARRVMNHNMMM